MKSVLVLLTGTMMAQGIGYLISPILTRIYSTEEMGELGVYMRIVGFISAIATARFELSLPLPKQEAHSFLLYKISLRISKIVLLCTVLVGIIYYVINPVNVYDASFLAITLVSTVFVIYINLGTNWSIRNKNFKQIARQRIVNSLTSNLLRWLFGALSFGTLGLIFATLIGYAVSSLSFIREYLHLDKVKYLRYSKKKSLPLTKEYRQFPMVNLPHVMVDLGRDLIIAALIVIYFGKDVFGLYSHSHMVLKIPLIVIGASVGQVFFNKCSELVNSGQSTFPLMKRTLGILSLLSIIPFSLIFFFGEPLFSFVFSEEWADSGYYSEIMAVWLMANFLISPLSSLPLVLKRQKEFFLIGIFGSLIQLFSFGVLPILYGTSEETLIFVLWFVSIAQAIYFSGVCMVTLYYAKLGVKGAKAN
ncbi:MAG: lipopolysaccharide biosynthesis protein [Crocinitomicaceae bacterium]|nr:lipopolysaccharide biosynthesis protein [Crocinitomicaceae bacterium]